MEKQKLTKLEKYWILYDVGNSAFVLLVSTIIPIYFNYLTGNAGVSEVDSLAYWGYAASAAKMCIRDRLECIAHTKLDMAILDVMLPDIDGFKICQKIREKYYYPVVMLTAKVEDTDKKMCIRDSFYAAKR